MVTWELDGGARAFFFTGETDNPERWEYFLDMGANLMIYVDGRPVPQDLALVHGVRNAIQEVATRRSLLVTLLDFIESFGASTQGTVKEIGEAETVASEGRALYLDLSFEEALVKYAQANDIYKEIELRAMELRDKTLLWVYAIDWLAMTGTALICGAAAWTLMVRRRLYRAVETTRFGAGHWHR